tara:strand:+ start:156 stop:365 length:210 start_codon:yes stop_codon:yes gene_type:complete
MQFTSNNKIIFELLPFQNEEETFDVAKNSGKENNLKTFDELKNWILKSNLVINSYKLIYLLDQERFDEN